MPVLLLLNQGVARDRAARRPPLRWTRTLLLAGFLGGLLPEAAGAQPAAPVPGNHPSRPTTGPARFFALLHRGDSVYAQKAGYHSFAQALTYYDQAQALADRSQDTLLLAEAVFARARVYDAWNKEPLKTIQYFQQAAALFDQLPAQRRRALYARHLVAHAYEKVPDAAHAAQALRQLRRELAATPDSVLRLLPFVVEMALSSTEVRQYALADTLLRKFTRRAWIRNDSATYDYLTHYYLVQSRLDAYYRHRPASPYLDSLQQAYRTTRPLLDRLFLAQNLARLLADAGRYQPAYRYLAIAGQLSDRLVDGGDLGRLRQALLLSEQRAQDQANAAQRTRSRAIWALSGALGIISLLSFYLARQSQRARRQTQHLGTANRQLNAANQELARVNERLDEQVAQVELLNKEIQHRVKNNLHILFSLLRMQERRTEHPEVLAQLQAARLRVESIALLHNQLMRQPDAPPLADFLRTLVSAVVACLANDRQVVTHLQTDALALSSDNYFPLSLILNEWVTNSIKYADTDGQVLEITIGVGQRGADTCLTYADNGRPPAPGTAAPPAGLGTQIIALLARQLRATLSTPPAHPYQFTLCIPAANGALD